MFRNQIIEGDPAQVLKHVPARSVDLIVTDPPYLVNYRDRDGRSLRNDTNAGGVMPALDPTARAMKPNSYPVVFAGRSALPQFTAATQAASPRLLSQIIWQNR